jgi:hypothetical protein
LLVWILSKVQDWLWKSWCTCCQGSPHPLCMLSTWASATQMPPL